MSEFSSSLVKCPYFIENFKMSQSKKNQIRCEGVEDNNKTTLVFRSKSAQIDYMIRYCHGIHTCKQCLIHRMLDEKNGVDCE